VCFNNQFNEGARIAINQELRSQEISASYSVHLKNRQLADMNGALASSTEGWINGG
jgi:hypothetical protein